MKSKFKFLFPAIILCTLFASCKTTPHYYDFESDDSNVACSGKISWSKKKKTVSPSGDDILLRGKFKKNKGAAAAMLVYGLNVRYKKWEGDIFVGRERFNPDVTFMKELNGMTELFFGGNFLQIKINNLDSGVRFPSFSILGPLQNEILAVGGLSTQTVSVAGWDITASIGPDSEYFVKAVSEREMPMRFTYFDISGKRFYAIMTLVEESPGIGEGARYAQKHNALDMMNLEGQIFQIVDEDDTVYAEYTKGEYKIFDVPGDFDVLRLKPVLASLCLLFCM